ncbi:hypothetical protein TEA_019229 [Camellia sinensis var. sinensis]|uniref:alpha,alpha-trehalase n=1 Tax=Camellia sinensis var. sinensis TaxID=542762 RepID=A0A4S4CXR4_CAMSN|nr:hypothetical protein TEA_019229 [Camellia sinensis var. sinensis]
MSTATPTPTPTCSNSGPVVPKTPLITFLEILQKTALNTLGPKNFNPKLYSYFNGAGEDLVHTEPVDFVPEPEGFLPEVVNWEVRAWALEVHSLWKNLRRKVSDRVLERPEFHTLLPLTKPVIIPGSRFREVNYWDSYWVIRGLLASKMYETAKGIVTNLISLIDEFGRVLNGARAYYTNRRNIETASKLMNDSAKQHLYRELASTAESGWDFSTRWMRNGSDLTTLATTSIIPVDLNAFILKMELDIVFLANVTGDCTISVHFQEAAQARKQAMNSVFGMQRWGNGLIIGLAMDLHARVTHGRPQTRIGIYLPQTSFLCGLSCLTQQVMQSLQSSGLIRAVGIATSLTNSGQQWDFPNGWAPLQHMIVEGLARSGSKEARSMAEDIAVRWIRTNYVAYKKSGAMHEKYDVEKCGEFGGGGEYIPQSRLPSFSRRSSTSRRRWWLSPLFIFIISNVIVITLLAKSGQLSSETLAINNAETDLYDELIKNIENEINYGPENCPLVPESKEIVYEEKQIVFELIAVTSKSNELISETQI